MVIFLYLQAKQAAQRGDFELEELRTRTSKNLIIAASRSGNLVLVFAYFIHNGPSFCIEGLSSKLHMFRLGVCTNQNICYDVYQCSFCIHI